jgi:hypothetical protein
MRRGIVTSCAWQATSKTNRCEFNIQYWGMD